MLWPARLARVLHPFGDIPFKSREDIQMPRKSSEGDSKKHGDKLESLIERTAGGAPESEGDEDDTRRLQDEEGDGDDPTLLQDDDDEDVQNDADEDDADEDDTDDDDADEDDEDDEDEDEEDDGEDSRDVSR